MRVAITKTSNEMKQNETRSYQGSSVRVCVFSTDLSAVQYSVYEIKSTRRER